jgi:hypothetical protein
MSSQMAASQMETHPVKETLIHGVHDLRVAAAGQGSEGITEGKACHCWP